MNQPSGRQGVHAVGIDLGTTYSCLSYLNPQGEPVTLPNLEGELATPSAVLFDGETPIVGTEALRNAVSHPERVIQNSKRHMGDPQKFWVIDGDVYRPPDVAALILRKLLDAAEEQLGPIRHAVITVPAQFSDLQRRATEKAGRMAGLKRVDIINEPVAAALCYVLSEGMWFAELANAQTVMVFDLGGGTFDLSLVKYDQHNVNVVASGGDLQLGGIDWNRRLEQFACDEFIKETPHDPRLDRESMQALANEAEQAKRSLSVRPKATVLVQHAGRRKTFGIDQEHFELISSDLVTRCDQITKQLLKGRKMGWAHVDTVLVTGGASRMPMIRKMLKRISGTTLNTALSPDQSISHGAAYYAGMLLSGEKFAQTYLGADASARLAKFKQVSVNARALGILVRDKDSGLRVPHFLIPANTPLPCAYQQEFGTVVENQQRVHLHIVESGTSAEQPFVKLGACEIDDLPPNLPEQAPIEVTIRYDEQARVHVEAKDKSSGQSAKATIVRPENVAYAPAEQRQTEDVSLDVAEAGVAAVTPKPPELAKSTFQPAGRPAQQKPKSKVRKKSTASKKHRVSLDRAERPVPLCNQCGEPLDSKGRCHHCAKGQAPAKSKARRKVKRPQVTPPPSESDILSLDANTADTQRMKTPKTRKGTKPKRPRSKSDEVRAGEDEFWDLTE